MRSARVPASSPQSLGRTRVNLRAASAQESKTTRPCVGHRERVEFEGRENIRECDAVGDVIQDREGASLALNPQHASERAGTNACQMGPRDIFQPLAADALKDNRASFLDLREDVFRGVSATNRRLTQSRGPAAQGGGTGTSGRVRAPLLSRSSRSDQRHSSSRRPRERTSASRARRLNGRRTSAARS